jgi:hypothetical protein
MLNCPGINLSDISLFVLYVFISLDCIFEVLNKKTYELIQSKEKITLIYHMDIYKS